MPQIQNPGGFGASLARSIPGAPLIAEQIEEHTIILPDGTSQIKRTETHIYRDNAGRLRIETLLPVPSLPGGIVLLADPVGETITLLLPSAKIAHIMRHPKDEPSLGIAFATMGIPMRGKNRKSESIGKRTIEGIECDGIRMTATSEDNPDTVTVDERWISKEWGLTALIEDTNPTEHYSAGITKIIREDPDPDLFAIPGSFEIRELEEGQDHPLL